MTGPLSNFIHKLETALRTKWLPRALFYGLIVAALFLKVDWVPTPHSLSLTLDEVVGEPSS